MANFEAFCWNFLSSTNPEIGRSDIAAAVAAVQYLSMYWTIYLCATVASSKLSKQHLKVMWINERPSSRPCLFKASRPSKPLGLCVICSYIAVWWLKNRVVVRWLWFRYFCEFTFFEFSTTHNKMLTNLTHARNLSSRVPSQANYNIYLSD